MMTLTKCILEMKWRRGAFKLSCRALALQLRWRPVMAKREERLPSTVSMRILICWPSIPWMQGPEFSLLRMIRSVICNLASNRCMVLELKLLTITHLKKKLRILNSKSSTRRLVSSTSQMRHQSYGRSRIWARRQKSPSRSLGKVNQCQEPSTTKWTEPIFPVPKAQDRVRAQKSETKRDLQIKGSHIQEQVWSI